MNLEAWRTAAFVFMLANWLWFVWTFGSRRMPAAAPERKRDARSVVGILFQGFGFFFVWFAPQVSAGAWWALPPAVQLGLYGVGALIALASNVFLARAVAALGRNWSFAARVVEGHQLVQDGPYAIVRHPIYTGLLGLLIATDFLIGQPILLPPALLCFGIGLAIRIRVEEGLLRETFGAAFDAYARRVPAVLPLPRRGA